MSGLPPELYNFPISRRCTIGLAKNKKGESICDYDVDNVGNTHSGYVKCCDKP
jgi:hypothetical protein